MHREQSRSKDRAAAVEKLAEPLTASGSAILIPSPDSTSHSLPIFSASCGPPLCSLTVRMKAHTTRVEEERNIRADALALLASRGFSPAAAANGSNATSQRTP